MGVCRPVKPLSQKEEEKETSIRGNRINIARFDSVRFDTAAAETIMCKKGFSTGRPIYYSHYLQSFKGSINIYECNSQHR